MVAIIIANGVFLQPTMSTPHRHPARESVCQSCGMPLQLDTAKQSEVGDSDDRSYCSHCYGAGSFVLPDLTVEQMQARVLEKLRQAGVAEPRARRLVRRIPTLRRWR